MGVKIGLSLKHAREEHRLGEYENTVLRRVGLLGTKREVVTEGWGKLHNDEFHVCTSP
jgi:hypothetical protein